MKLGRFVAVAVVFDKRLAAARSLRERTTLMPLLVVKSFVMRPM